MPEVTSQVVDRALQVQKEGLDCTGVGGGRPHKVKGKEEFLREPLE